MSISLQPAQTSPEQGRSIRADPRNALAIMERADNDTIRTIDLGWLESAIDTYLSRVVGGESVTSAHFKLVQESHLIADVGQREKVGRTLWGPVRVAETSLVAGAARTLEQVDVEQLGLTIPPDPKDAAAFIGLGLGSHPNEIVPPEILALRGFLVEVANRGDWLLIWDD